MSDIIDEVLPDFSKIGERLIEIGVDKDTISGIMQNLAEYMDSIHKMSAEFFKTYCSPEDDGEELKRTADEAINMSLVFYSQLSSWQKGFLNTFLETIDE